MSVIIVIITSEENGKVLGPSFKVLVVSWALRQRRLTRHRGRDSHIQTSPHPHHTDGVRPRSWGRSEWVRTVCAQEATAPIREEGLPGRGGI